MRALFAVRLRMRTDVFRGVALIGLLAILAGCGGGVESKEPTTNVKVNHTITTVSQAAADPADFGRLFAEGATVPEADREKYTGFFFFAKSDSLEVSGNSATAQVTVQDNEGNDVAMVEWTLELVEETWKLKTAPLP